MRSSGIPARTVLVALLLLAFAGSAQAKAVRGGGLRFTETQGTRLDATPNGLGVVATDVDGDGLIDFTVALGGLDGHSMSFGSSLAQSPAGTQHTFVWSCVGVNETIPYTQLHVSRTVDGLTSDVDLSHMTSSPTMLCLLYLDNALVTSFTCPVTTSFDTHVPAPVITVDPADVSLELDRVTHHCVCSMGFSSSRVLVFGGGQSASCDRVIFACTLDGDATLDHCDFHEHAIGSPDPPVAISTTSCVRDGMCVTTDFDLDGRPDLVTLHENPLYSGSQMQGTNPLYERAFDRFASGGGGGGGGAGGTSLVWSPRSNLDVSSPVFGMQLSRTSPLVLDPSATGASLLYRVRGGVTCTGPDVGRLSLTCDGHAIAIGHDFSGMCADQDSVFVSSQGAIVYRAAVTASSVVTLAAPPGGSSSTAVTAVCGGKITKSRSNIQNNLQVGPGGENATVVGADGLDLALECLQKRVFCVDGHCSDGDGIAFHGQCSTASCPVITVVGSGFTLRSCSSGQCSSSFDVLALSRSTSDRAQVSAVLPATVALSSTRPVVRATLQIETPINGTPARGCSVTLHLSPNLVLSSAVEQGDYFSSSGQQSQMFVVDNGGGSYTIDSALLGPGCGPTGSGVLCRLPLSRAPGAADGLGTVTVDAVELADCNAAPLPAEPGDPAFVTLDSSAPSPVSLTCTQVETGNDADGTIQLALSWTSPEPFASVQLYRAPWGGYPDFTLGSQPPPLTLPQQGRWTAFTPSCGPGSTGLSQCVDDVSIRDAYEFSLVVVDAAGNVSAPAYSSVVPNFHLGDVAGGGSLCSGDNQVTTADISGLGASYGATLPPGSPVQCLDVGPTECGGVHCRPLSDHRLNFKDLMLYAINFSLVSRPADGARPAAAVANELRLTMPANLPGVGGTFDVTLRLAGAGDAQGISTQLAWDPAVVEPVAVARGDLAGRQGRDAVVLSAQPGNVDAALLGVGPGFAGEGELARVSFRVKAAGDPAIGIGSVEARDAQLRSLAMGFIGAPNAAPGRTALRLAFPNPFERSTTVVFALGRAGPASVRVYDVAGRNVRTLVQGVQPAGERVVAWDGRDDQGAGLGAGVYLLRLEAGGHSETRAVRLVK